MKHIIAKAIAGGALVLALALSPLTVAPSFAAAPHLQNEQTQLPARPDLQRRVGAAALTASLIRATADVTGLTPQQVIEQLNTGKSLTQIAADNGKTEQDVVAVSRTRLNSWLDQLVANGRISRERADEVLKAFDENTSKVMNDQQLGKKIEWARRVPVAVGLVHVTADMTGLTPQQVTEQLRAGKSIAQIASEHGTSADDILAELRKRGQERLDQALKRAEQLINTSLPAR